MRRISCLALLLAVLVACPVGGPDPADTGDSGTLPDTGDTAADSGDTAGDTGDTGLDTGETGADTGVDSGDSGAETGDTGTETGDSGDCLPVGTSVPPGVYGGAHYEFTVEADGFASLLGDCSLATVEAVPVSAGAVSWTFRWQSGYGLPVHDTAEIEYIDVNFVGTFCGDELSGTLTFPDATTSLVDVVLGVPAEITACL